MQKPLGASAMTTLVVLAICLLATQTSAATHKCCQSYSRGRIPFRIVESYSIQTVKELCPINSIIFHTKKGKACTDPTLHWVMEYINQLRNKAQTLHKASQA